MTQKIEWGHEPAGPWDWFGGRTDMYLASTHSGRLYAMGFQRRGLNGAQPSFRTAEGRLRKADELVTFEVGDGKAIGFKAAEADESVYRYDIRGINNPIARAAKEIPGMVAMMREMIPANVCLTNANIPDSLNVPLDVPMGDLRKIAAILARIDGEA